MPDVITLGELLIDFVPATSGVTLIEATSFKKAAGGAPANVAAGVAQLGHSSGFIGKVGNDAFGHFLAQALRDAGVDVSQLHFSDEARTGLAFISLRADGEREFMFYRHPSADMLHKPEEIDPPYIQSAKVFHYGSISLISEPARSATLHAIEIARAAGLLLSYDPNLRLALWPDAEAAQAGILLALPYADIVKISAEELEFLTGTGDLLAGSCKLWQPNHKLMIITRGKHGCAYFTMAFSGEVAGFSAETVDTTGAGDGFVAGLLKGLLDTPEALADERRLRDICRYANAVGALVTTARGAIPALPTHARVAAFLRQAE